VVMRGLATDPAERFASAESLAIALAQPAVQCWGADWLAPVGIPVIGAASRDSSARPSRYRAGQSISAHRPVDGGARRTQGRK
jgi:serine/threonine-protein kinase